MNKNAKIFVTGHKGLVGSAVIRRLKKLGFKNILTVSILSLLTGLIVVYLVFSKLSNRRFFWFVV